MPPSSFMISQIIPAGTIPSRVSRDASVVLHVPAPPLRARREHVSRTTKSSFVADHRHLNRCARPRAGFPSSLNRASMPSQTQSRIAGILPKSSDQYSDVRGRSSVIAGRPAAPEPRHEVDLLV
jgi:hypothetical protein